MIGVGDAVSGLPARSFIARMSSAVTSGTGLMDEVGGTAGEAVAFATAETSATATAVTAVASVVVRRRAKSGAAGEEDGTDSSNAVGGVAEMDGNRGLARATSSSRSRSLAIESNNVLGSVGATGNEPLRARRDGGIGAGAEILRALSN